MFDKINFKVRFMNKAWVSTFIAAIFVLIYAIGNLFGFELDLTNLQNNIIKVIYAIFGIMTVLGVTIDGTTDGVYDSEKALTYTAPGVDENEFEDEVYDLSDEDISDDEFDYDEMAKTDEIEEE